MTENMVRYSTGYIQIQDVLHDEEPSIDNSLLFDDDLREILNTFEDEIDYYVPRIQSFALAATDDITRGSFVIGVDPQKEALINNVADDIVKGRFIDIDSEGIVVAEGLANILKLELGDTLVLLGQGFQGATAAGKYVVEGIVKLNVPELNNNSIYMAIPAAQWFFMADDRLTNLIIMPVNPNHTHQIAERLNDKLDSEWYIALTWDIMLADLIKLMEFDMAGTMVLLMILYIVIGFGLFGTILTMMIERQKEFRLLFAVGMKRAKLAVVCLLETIFISLAGVLVGIIGAIPIVLYFFYNPIQLTGDMAEAMMDYGFEPIMPFSVDPAVFYSQALVVLAISIVVGIAPVYKVYKLKLISEKK